MPKLSGFVFDFDGTLAVLNIDFVGLKRTVVAMAKAFDVFIEDKILDLPLLELISALESRIPSSRDFNIFKISALRLIKDAEIKAAKKGKLFHFTKPLLNKLKRLGFFTAIITRNCDTAVRIVFPDIEHYCHVFLPRESVKRVKPHPEHINAALTKFGKSKDSCLIIGDHPLDIVAGCEVGIMTAGVGSGRITEVKLKEAGADFVAPDCLELFRRLQREGLINGFDL